MALQIDKRLYEEQYYGGFEPGDPDDETFLLERLEKYPGDLPFDLKETETENFDFLEESEEDLQKVKSEKVEVDKSISAEEQVPRENIPPSEISVEEFAVSSLAPSEEFEREGRIEREVIPYEKAGIEKTEQEPFTYEKAGVEKTEREVQPYQKAGLIEDEEAVPFERQGVEKQAKEFTEPQGKGEKVQSIWDIFEEEKVEEAPSETTSEETTEPPLPESEITQEAVAETAPEGEQTPEAEPLPEMESQETESVLLESDSIVDVPLEIKVAKVDPEEFSKVFDEDFRNTILEDLAKSEERKKTRTKPTEDTVIISTREKEELQREIDKLEGTPKSEGEAVEFDLSAFPTGKPSEMIAQDILESGELEKKKKKKKKKEKAKPEKAVEEAIQEPAEEELVEAPTETVSEEAAPPSVVEVQAEQPTEPEPQPEESKPEEKEKKRRKVPVLWLLSGALLLLLILLIGGYFAYLYFIKKPLPESKKLMTKVEDGKKAAQKVTEPQVKKEVEKPVEPRPQPPPEFVEETKVPPSKPLVKAEKEKLPKAVESTVPKAKPALERKPETSKEKRFVSKFETFAKTQKVKVVEVPPEDMTSPKPVEEYAIEIYSTPEIEEANYWVNQLQLKGINAYIKPFRVRNVNYYKIRIGPFRSIEEAKQVARSLGFKNFWIDRVK